MKQYLEQYGVLLREVDVWFAACNARYPDLIACRRGCAACCRGLFDITLLDALYMAQGVAALSADLQNELRTAAIGRLASLQALVPGFTAPWLLNCLDEASWQTLMPFEDETPCLLLSDEGVCRIYDHRPMTCRLHGIPNIDIGEEDFSEGWCTRNFVDLDPLSLNELRYPFKGLFSRELLLFREATRQLFGVPYREIDTLIPAVFVLDMVAIAASLASVPHE